MTITSFRDLYAWSMSMHFAESVYQVTTDFPQEEKYGLTSQLRRSVVGVTSNIAEGHQHGPREYRRYLRIALGCLAECETQLELARRLKLAPDALLKKALQEAKPVGRVVHGLLRSLPDR